MPRILIFGNSGSGKSILAGALAAEYDIPCLDLDTITWESPGERRELAASIAALDSYIADHDGWIIEGCYGSLIEHAAPHCTDMRFLNPGIDACVRNNESRPWEPHKYESLDEQNRHFEFLQKWVREYESRDDEFSLTRHQQIYDTFAGQKQLTHGEAPFSGP